jgi:hypothetical protein
MTSVVFDDNRIHLPSVFSKPLFDFGRKADAEWRMPVRLPERQQTFAAVFTLVNLDQLAIALGVSRAGSFRQTGYPNAVRQGNPPIDVGRFLPWNLSGEQRKSFCVVILI